MAHNIHIKASAMADLLLGASVVDVASANRIPERTVRRWRNEAWAMVRLPGGDDGQQELADPWPVLRHNGRSAWGHARCNAKTRSGEPCLNAPVRDKRRCRMHGGRVERRNNRDNRDKEGHPK